MKSILISTESFTFGGLETHIVGEIASLSRVGYKVHLVVGAQFNEALLPQEGVSVTSGLAFDPQATVSELVDSVEKLRKLIRQNAVEFIHAHPFTSLISSFIAAELEGISFGLTLHGPASIGDYYGPIYDFIQKAVILPNAGLVVAVSEEVLQIATPYISTKNALLLPNGVNFDNAVDGDKFVNIDPRWVLVSRLDSSKSDGIVDFVQKAQSAGIPGVLLVGDGAHRENLQDIFEQKGLAGYVDFLGFRTDVQQLMRTCAGVAGMGRVVLEGIANKRPVFLVGYDGVKGIIDEALFLKAKYANFSGRNLFTIDAPNFSKQVKRFKDINLVDIRNLMSNGCTEQTLWGLFLNRVSQLRPQKPTILGHLYRTLLAEGISDNQPFIQSDVVLKHIGELVHGVKYSSLPLVSSFQYYKDIFVDMKTIHTFAERDAKIAGLHHVVAELNIQVAALNQAIVESDVQIVNLERAEAECREEISSLTQTLSENEREISDARQQLMVATDRYIAVMNSNSMKLTAFARTFRRTIAQGAYLCAAFMRAARSHGVRHAISKAKTYIEREADRPESASEIAVSNQEQYLIRKSVQNGYLTNYLAVGLDASHSELIREQFAVRVTESRKLVIYPLSYSMSLTQRPDHILRNFSESGYWCIVISIDDNPPFIKEISNNIFLTNLFAAVISYFSRSEIVFYITYPFFSYIINHLQKPIVVYDVLDDLSVFSSPCEAMTADHKKLLERADVTLFSSQELFDANRDDVRGHAALVSNGVWAKDFVVDPENAHRKVNFKKYPDEFVIGYHGAITELLDWGLLEQLIQIPRVRLVLVGPVAHFDNVDADISRATQERVLAADQVTHVKTVPYVDLKYYLSGFDAGIVPFVVNEKTHPVSPLKLFEYMAIGLMVFATPTRTLSRYSQFICVDDRAILPERVRAFVNGASNSFAMADYSSVLMDADWGRQLELVISVLEDKKTNSKRSFRKLKTVDITNINFFDWDGVNLYKGGAERYVYDLACMLKDEGWAPRLIQNANRAFECDFRGISVVGVQTDSGHNLRGMSKKFRDECCDADLIIASPADLACEMRGLNVVGINHGIYWDHKFKKLENSNANEYINIFDAIKISSSVVAVDTNFINWVRTYDHGLGSKITYIPNYVDSSHFMPTQKDFEGKIRILYPRRLYEARGIFITLKAFDYLFERHDNIELHLVGQSDSKDEKVVSEFIGKHCGRVLWEELDMDEMPKAYQASHIVLVPTMYSEGTSLSCLEAMATNNVVVATNVGGLPNLVVDGFNGLLISPTVEELIRSIETLLVNRGLMQSMATKGVELSAAFRKERWLARWRSVISDTVK